MHTFFILILWCYLLLNCLASLGIIYCVCSILVSNRRQRHEGLPLEPLHKYKK